MEDSQYRLIFDQSPAGMINLEISGVIINFNNSFLKMLDYENWEINDRKIDEIIFNLDLPSFQIQYNKMISGEFEHFTSEVRFIKKNGAYLWMNAIVSYLKSPKKDIIVCFLEDITYKKRLEEHQKESWERYRKLANSIGDMFIALDNHLRFTYWNQTCESMFGLKAEGILGTSLYSLLPKFKDTEYEKIIFRAIQSKENNSFILKYPINNELKYFEVYIYASQNGISILSRDITEKKSYEIKLLEMAAIIESSNDAVVGVTLDGIIKSWNPAAQKIFGYSKEEAIGKEMAGLLSLGIEDSNTVLFNKIGLGELVENYEARCKDKFGGIKFISITLSPIKSTEGSILGISTIIRDITKRKISELNIRKLSTAIEQISSMIIITDTSGYIEYVNPKLTEITGYSMDELKGQNPRILKGPENDDLKFKELWEMITGGKEWRGEFINKKKNGELFITSTSISPIKSHDGKILNFVAIEEDITEKKETLEALEKQAKELERSNQELQQFAYLASHDLKEPLRMIGSYSQLLSIRYKDKFDENGNEFIDYILEGVSRMQSLIDDLLKYSRINPTEKEFTLVDMNQVLKYTLRTLKSRIEETDAIISYNPLPVVLGDEITLGQVLQNLIINSLKFVDEPPPKIHVSCSKEANNYIFSISDNGIGITPENREKIFILFKRLHTKMKFSGTGIGLAICKKIIELHRGKIWVDSNPNKGSVFYFSIPRFID